MSTLRLLQRLTEPKAAPAAEASEIQHSRIVIIRRKAEDMETCAAA